MKRADKKVAMVGIRYLPEKNLRLTADLVVYKFANSFGASNP